MHWASVKFIIVPKKDNTRKVEILDDGRRFLYLLEKKHTSRRALIKKLDGLFSHYIRHRDGWKCIRCGKQYHPPTNALHNSHFWSRRYMGARYQEDNCDAICYGCHRFIESDKQKGSWYYEFKLKQLGEERFQMLEIKAKGRSKFSILDLEIMLDNFDQFIQ